jgi:Ras-related protein Rab-6A
MKAHRIVALGDSGVGKTSLISKLINANSSVADQATIGIDFVSTNANTPTGAIRLQIWDTAGQEQFRSLIPTYLRGSSIAILVYSIDSRESFESVPRWLHFLQEIADPRLIVAANKTDLSGRAISADEGAQFAATVNAPFIETSALEGRNLDELLAAIVAIPPPDGAPPPPIPQEKPIAGSGGFCGC